MRNYKSKMQNCRNSFISHFKFSIKRISQSLHQDIRTFVIQIFRPVIPVKAGVQKKDWIPHQVGSDKLLSCFSVPITQSLLRGYLFFDSRRGFTLLELTISITMIGFIVLIIVGALGLGFRSVESGEKKIESFERIRSSINIINSQVQSQIPLKYINEDGVEGYYFKGKTGFMQFATNYSIWGGEKGYVIVTYKIETGNNGKQILFVSENIIGMHEQRDAKLFDNFDRIHFEYFKKDTIEDKGFWTEYLSEENIIPEKVRLHLLDGTREFSMIIPVRTSDSMSQMFGKTEKFTGPFKE